MYKDYFIKFVSTYKGYIYKLRLQRKVLRVTLCIDLAVVSETLSTYSTA